MIIEIEQHQKTIEAMKNGNNEKMYFYESFADASDSKITMYNTNKRQDVVLKIY
jgi:hypothetical protein